jgi:hypothetical protein
MSLSKPVQSTTMSKRMINDQWTVRELMNKLNSQEISKPKFQRKRKWDVLPKNNNTPNDKAYIQFLFEIANSVHAITFGQELVGEKIMLSNIDGNNRINAIKHFMDKPFEIFPEYLTELLELIRKLELIEEDKDTLVKIFTNVSYIEIMTFKYKPFFIKYGGEELHKKMIPYRQEIDDEIIEKLIQPKLTIHGSDYFDLTVKINVNIFQGYGIDELCKTFEDINKYSSKLTETELLACQLFNEVHFDITDPVFKVELERCIKEYYSEKAENEVLDCYIYVPAQDRINAHDFIVAFQNFCHEKYPTIIEKTDVDGLSLYFKLYRLLYGSYTNTFTTENVNNFKERILDSCAILNQIESIIFTDKINNNLFNTTCQDKLSTLKKNNIFMILSSILGFKKKNTRTPDIEKHIEKCLLYHFMVSDLKNKEKKDEFKNHDSITYTAGGGFIVNATENLLTTPEDISNKITKERFENLLSQLFIEVNNPHERKLENGKNKNDKRRCLKFFEKTLMFYMYKQKISTNMLDNDFSIEHICPNSSEWKGELDKDRTGNLIPIIASMNSSRGNKHIRNYSTTPQGKDFCEFIKKIIPDVSVYDKIVSHQHTKPLIINNELYNTMCTKNEDEYKQNFIQCLFS